MMFHSEGNPRELGKSHVVAFWALGVGRAGGCEEEVVVGR